MKILINGQILDDATATVSVKDRAYLFGEGLFETFRSYHGVIPFIDKHFNRMEWGATFINIPFPHPGEMKKEIEKLLKLNNLKNARIKIVLSGLNSEGFRPVIPTEEMAINLVITCEPFLSLSEEEYEQGVEMVLIRSVHNDPPPSSNIKSTNWLTKMMAKRELLEKEAFDGVLLNALGYVTETTAANLFWVEKEVLCTAPASAGLLPGVTREVIIDLAKDDGFLFKEKLIREDELKRVDEIFITGSTLEIMPVTKLDGQDVGSGCKGPITKRLMELYQTRLQEEIVAWKE